MLFNLTIYILGSNCSIQAQHLPGDHMRVVPMILIRKIANEKWVVVKGETVEEWDLKICREVQCLEGGVETQVRMPLQPLAGLVRAACIAQQVVLLKLSPTSLMSCSLWSWLVGQWAFPGGTAIPGRPMTEPEQAPEPYPLTKISLISRRHMAFISDIKLIRTDTTLWS